MKSFKKLLLLITVSILLLLNFDNSICAKPYSPTKKTVKAAVFLNNMNDLFISDVKKALEIVQKENDNTKKISIDSLFTSVSNFNRTG